MFTNRLAHVRRARHSAGRVVLAALTLVFAAGCAPSEEDPRAAVEALVEAGIEAAEAGDHAALAALLAGDYEDAAGRDRRQAGLYLRVLFRRYPSPVFARRGLEIELDSPVLARAQVDLAVVARRGSAARDDGDDAFLSADLIRLQLALRRDDGEWRVTRAERR